MTPHAARSYAITLAIAITIIGPRVSGFTIDRTENTLSTQALDLTTTESIQLQLNNDVKRPNDSKTSTEKDSITTTKNDLDKTISTIIPIRTEKIQTKITTAESTTVSSTTEFARIPTISSDTVEVFDSVEETTFYNNSEKIINTTKSIIQSTTISLPISAAELALETTKSTLATKQPLKVVSSFESPGKKFNETENNAIRAKTPPQPLEDYKTTTSMFITTGLAFNTTEPITITTNANISDTVGAPVTDISLITTNSPEILFETTKNTAIDIDEIKLPETSTLSNLESTQTATAKIETKFTDPFLKKYTKYTTIVRKRVPNSEETTTKPIAEEETMKTETSNTLVNFERDFNVTLIPSLYKTRSELLSNVNRSLGIEDEIQKNTSPYVVESNADTRTGSVQSLRAGYLDNSEKITTPLPSTKAVETTTISEVKKENVKDTPTYTKALETENPVLKKVTVSESQSQLAEYAIQEELLKEEALSMHKENARRYQGSNELFKQINASEDPLTVQPIERSKTTIYTISPNYKPMKKIDVQPAKPFVRDPDDNSWRNESISSLGIVFKPKNSSKSFKEVLKNKTQIELNNLIEKTKDDVPDLRLRLEKIAEVRKTKKKKMNKDGEIVYTDYEEGNSAEISTTPKINPISSIFSFDDTSGIITTLRTLTEPELATPPTKLKNSDKPMDKNSSGVQSLFSQNLDQLTTLKSTKFFNAAEYYDTTDEYDIDYVTMPNLDLKKFPVPSTKTTETIPSTKPTETYMPERKPTVQYFPPREPQKVNINNPDEDFEKKINLYTYKDHPRIDTHLPFVTLPPLPIGTRKPHSEMRHLLPVQRPRVDDRPDMRATVKPADFTVYSPANLNKNFYISNTQASTDPQDALLIDGGNIDRGSYVIKHYRDFLNAAVKDDEEDRRSDFLPFHATQTHQDAEPSTEPEKQILTNDDEEDYEVRFRKEVINRFVDNFNQNSERFKVDFPILYNNSIVHREGSGAPAASRAFLRRQYNNEVATRGNGLVKKPCEPNCEMTVELSPAYELHYYVPGQEEREEQEQKTRPPTQPYRYSL